jgi:hypothetical protein
MKRIGAKFRPTYANVVGVIALVLALGGVSYAATALPGKSVGTKQLTRNAVVGSKVKNGSLLATDVKGKLPKGKPGPTGDQGPVGTPGVQGAASTATRTVLSGSATMATSNEFIAVSGHSVGDANEPAVTTLSPARPMIARNFSVQLSNPPGVGKTRRFDVRVNNLITTDLECTITHPETTCTSVGTVKDQLLIPANSRISIGNVSSGGPAAATQVRFGFTLENAP